LQDILIVSGGGGGAYYYADKLISDGGSAGGYKGSSPINPICNWVTRNYYVGEVSNQTTGGQNNMCSVNNHLVTYKVSEFGNGGFYSQWSSGGGGGLYGGGFGWAIGAGGGSSYIGNSSLKDKSMYCYECEESLDLTRPDIFTISTTGNTNYRDTLNCPDGYDENPVSKCAKKGDGYARITLLSKK